MFSGRLFTTHFLRNVLPKSAVWQGCDGEALAKFRDDLLEVFARVSPDSTENETNTIDKVIVPILGLVDWKNFDKEIGHDGSFPDILLYKDQESQDTAKAAAKAEQEEILRYQYGTSIVEAKRYQRKLDRLVATPHKDEREVPSTQMLRYMNFAALHSNNRIRFTMLSNGRIWRIYWNNATSRAQDYFEVDLAVVLELEGYEAEENIMNDLEAPLTAEHNLRIFYCLFRRESFIRPLDGYSFHEISIDEAKQWEIEVTRQVANAVYLFFPKLVRAIAETEGEKARLDKSDYLEELRYAAMVLLYRLMFIIYAEDRALLPLDKGYFNYSLRKLRLDITKLKTPEPYSKTRFGIFCVLKDLFEAIDQGDSSLDLPAYNGGLFSVSENRIVNDLKVSDYYTMQLIDTISRTHPEDPREKPKLINYRDVNVQHLGNIYEGLLEKQLVVEKSIIEVRPSIFARKASGSFYTPEILVQLVLDQSLADLVNERRAAFEVLLENNGTVEELEKIDPAVAILGLKVCDPAMGSGHFLVSLVDFLSDRVMETLAHTQHATEKKFPKNAPYQSPLQQQVTALRDEILSNAKANNWLVTEQQLDDKNLIRRFVLKRCVYGVDKNSLAVDLAKLSIWLHSFTVGAPLSFLDHHILCGDSLFGEWVGEFLQQESMGLFTYPIIQTAFDSVRDMREVELAPDANIDEVKASARHYADMVKKTKSLTRLLDLFHAKKWLPDPQQVARLDRLFNNPDEGKNGHPKSILESYLEGEALDVDESLLAAFEAVRVMQKQEHFMHWQVQFPGVWENWSDRQRHGGFDAVVGNPPWNVMKLKEIEWFVERDSTIASQETKAGRTELIATEVKNNSRIGMDFLAAQTKHNRAIEIAKASGDYPLLSGGDLNIYSLFVERAHGLIKANGIVGLVTPSGIYSDLSASKFFKSVSTTGRLRSLFDFENRAYHHHKYGQNFFPDVDSRFKFCVTTTGGIERQFKQTLCGFMLTGPEMRERLGLDKDDKLKKDLTKHLVIVADNRILAIDHFDFKRFNPNSGTAPIFTSPRELKIARNIYERIPILNRHSDEDKKDRWQVEQLTMFHMSNDSHQFKTRAQLRKMGCTESSDRKFIKNAEEYFPLQVGKTIYHYDHRYNGVKVNLDNRFVAAGSDKSSYSKHLNPGFTPEPQFWVDKSLIQNRTKGLNYFLGFRSITNKTNARTMIATIIPASPCGNSLPVIFPLLASHHLDTCVFLGANLSSFAFDYCARQKVQGTNMNWYIVEQLPVIKPSDYQQHKFGTKTAAEIIIDHVLRLTYTAYDLQPFARDLGYTGEPFEWNEYHRRHLMARLDALYMLLYGLEPDEAGFILDSFPIVRKEDEKEISGHFLTKDLILAYMELLNGGDWESNATLSYWR